MNKFIPYFLLLSLLFTASSFSEETSSGYTVIENKAKLPILTPSLKDRQVIKLKLANGLQAYVVSDPNTDKSGAALSITVGSWYDAPQYPGIAHFNEHMLFLGTKKYPDESGYDRYITEHDGESNAYTANDQTSFMFSVNNDAFLEALDRFASFFKEPLFNPSGVSREMHAIDQEYAKNVEDDDFREMYVRKDLANSSHPFHAFSMGNSSTLTKVSQSALKQWYHSHYSANLMHLVVYSKLPLDKLKDLVVEDFSGIPNSDIKYKELDEPFFPKSLNGKIAYIVPFKDIRTLTLMWVLPHQFDQMIISQPYSIVNYVLGDEGKGSLLDNLKKEKLATAIECDKWRLAKGNIELYISIDLTDLGVHQVYTVIERVFQAIANFKEKGVPSYLFNNIKDMGITNYQYASRKDVFNDMMKQSEWITQEDLSTYPEELLVLQKFDQETVIELLNYMTPQNCQIDLMAPPDITGVQPDKTEPWLGASYAVKPIPQKILAEWIAATPNPNIVLPPPNPFIPTNLKLVNENFTPQESTAYNPHPIALIDNDYGKIYYAPDARYRIPKIYWYFEIKTPEIYVGNASKIVLGDLFVEAMKESLSEFSYPATLAELNFDIERKDNGIGLTLEGYSDKAPLLFNEILKSLVNKKFSVQHFKIYKDSLLREYQNFSKDMPIKQSMQIFKKIIYKNFTTEKEKAIAIKKINLNDFQDFVDRLFKQNYVEGLLYGNLTEAAARTLTDNLLSSFKGIPYPKNDRLKPSVIILPKDEGPFYIESKIKVNGDAALLVIEDSEFSFKERAAQQIYMQAISDPFFETLRTKQQTAYIVYSDGLELEKHLYDVFGVQSNSHEPRDLLARFELFLESYQRELGSTELTKERFDIIQSSLLKTLEEPQKSIKEMGLLLQTLAFKYEADFDWMLKRIQGFKDLTYPEFIEITQRILGKENKERLGILLKGNLPQGNVLDYKRTTINQLQKMSTFKGLFK